jgi:SHAQKYF class myb-like DNA-binding protein
MNINKFIEALKLYGKDWTKVQQYVGTRSSTQARSHAQKFFQRLEKINQSHYDFLKELREEKGIKPEYLIEYEFDEDSDVQPEPEIEIKSKKSEPKEEEKEERKSEIEERKEEPFL